MNTHTTRDIVAAKRAGKSRKPRNTTPPTSSIITRGIACIQPQARDAMIAEAAYFRSADRGFKPGNEVDDWLAAESQIDLALAHGEVPLVV